MSRSTMWFRWLDKRSEMGGDELSDYDLSMHAQKNGQSMREARLLLAGEGPTLQQAWISDLGELEWRDVPTVKEGE